MNSFRKTALKVLSYPYLNVKKHYKTYRRVLEGANPFFKPLYNLLDHKIMVEDREIPIRVFFPKKVKNPKVLLFFHGGGWVTGNIDSYTNTCGDLAQKTKQVVVSVDYRLAPEHPFPAGLEDCYHVTKELFSHPELLHCKPEDITLIGDSAGGNLAAAVSLMARERGEFFPSRQILLYPATYNDHGENSPFPSAQKNGSHYILTTKRLQDYMDLYVQREEDLYSPYLAPLLAPDLSHQPKTLIITAEYDPLRDEGEAYGIRLKQFGNPVTIYRMKDALHGFFSLPWHSKHVIKSYEIINGFLQDPID